MVTRPHPVIAALVGVAVGAADEALAKRQLDRAIIGLTLFRDKLSELF